MYMYVYIYMLYRWGAMVQGLGVLTPIVENQTAKATETGSFYCLDIFRGIPIPLGFFLCLL